MGMNQRRIVISTGGRPPGVGTAPSSAPPRGLVSQVAGFAVGVVGLVAAFVFSLVLFAVLLSVGAIAGGYLWWKTRALRAQLRALATEQAGAAAPTGPATQGGATTIEGEFTREAQRRDPAVDPMRARHDRTQSD